MEPLALSGTYRLTAGILLGAAFGFVLVRSGIAWRKTIMDQLSMKSTFFLKMFFVSVSVGTLLFYFAHKWGIVHYNFRPTFFWAAALGGLISAVGITICGQVPATVVASIAAGRLYSIWVLAGMLVAMPIVHLVSGWLSGTVYNWPTPFTYNENLQDLFSGNNFAFWVAGISMLLCFFFEFVRSAEEDKE